MKLHNSVTNTKTKNIYNILEKQFNEVHNGIYTYNNAVYINGKTKILITCPIHGDFSQTR